MATIQQQIADKFVSKLTESGDVDAVKIEKLKMLLSENRRVKAEDFIKIFTLPFAEDVK